MNTNDEKIQWHPAFDAALQIELGEETKYLEFDSEHLLSKKCRLPRLLTQQGLTTIERVNNAG